MVILTKPFNRTIVELKRIYVVQILSDNGCAF